jgi:hypothetical protein
MTIQLAQKSLLHEKHIAAEQKAIIAMNKFIYSVRYLDKQQLINLKAKILLDLKRYPQKSFFFNFLLNAVDKQLKKLCKTTL